MDFSKEIKTLQKAIDFLHLLLDSPLEKLSQKEIGKLATKLTKYVDDIYYIDDLMPLEEFAEKFDKRKDREAFFEVLDLLDEAFGLLDQIAGPEEEVQDGLPVDDEKADAAVDEAVGGIDDLYAELIKNMKPGRHAS